MRPHTSPFLSRQATMSDTTTQTATFDLVVSQPLTQSTPSQVGDQAGNQSLLYLTTDRMSIGAPTDPNATSILQVSGSRPNNPLLSITNTNPDASQNPEAAIVFGTAADTSGTWSLGVGGVAGQMKFFLHSIGGNALLLDTQGNLTVLGTVTASGLNVSGSTTLAINGAAATLTNLPPVQQAPQNAALASVVVDTSTGKLYAV